MTRWLLLLALCAPAVMAEERILEFHSDVVIQQDGWIEVTERITVRAEGNRIQRGIYRDFPTQYEDQYGNAVAVAFRPLAVLRNDQPEQYHQERYANGVRVYFGSADRYLEPAEYTYSFRYRANRMLGHFENHDELYWNITGLDWAFYIDKASATYRFDFEVDANSVFVEAFTGPLGATGRDYTASVGEGPSVSFVTTRTLSPHEGITTVVGWPRDLVSRPDFARKAGWFLQDNLNALVSLGGLLLLWVYCYFTWRAYGRDPDPGVLVTRYEPPGNYSPASLRYVRQMYYDNKTMTAAVVSLAVKGYLRINATVKSSGFFNFGSKENEHSLTRLDPGEAAPPLAAGEAELYAALFAEGDTVVLENDNHKLLGAARRVHARSLQNDYNDKYFLQNSAKHIPAILLVILTAVGALRLGGPTLLVVIAIIAMIITLIAFAHVMKRPTLRGRKLLDELAGFRDYLEVAEKDELNLRNPPKKTPELFEAYLPYALALGVDQLWAEKFAGVLAAAQHSDGSDYSPGWYNGAWNVNRLTDSTSHISSSLNTAISSSVTPPGSSSGSGGGSSGGGGGGGGGGGW